MLIITQGMPYTEALRYIEAEIMDWRGPHLCQAFRPGKNHWEPGPRYVTDRCQVAAEVIVRGQCEQSGPVIAMMCKGHLIELKGAFNRGRLKCSHCTDPGGQPPVIRTVDYENMGSPSSYRPAQDYWDRRHAAADWEAAKARARQQQSPWPDGRAVPDQEDIDEFVSNFFRGRYPGRSGG